MTMSARQGSDWNRTRFESTTLAQTEKKTVFLSRKLQSALSTQF